MRNLDEIIELAEHWARLGGHEQSAAAGELYSLIRDLAEHLTLRRAQGDPERSRRVNAWRKYEVGNR